ncbi:hypothetical protein SAMN04488539_0647 [Corynebacterium timonense]|uniref:Regulatory protein, gntR family n=1 Tax=Corynebacterium timonense TaxID=441500 RepID=A0A1H1MZ49_9CORY|nr:hypothetical protein SAMN04488539_0647 [Corynebacterium timonense]
MRPSINIFHYIIRHGSATPAETGIQVGVTLDPLSTVPLYQQVRDRVVQAIGHGELQRGDALASARQLEDGRNRGSIRRGSQADIHPSDGIP